MRNRSGGVVGAVAAILALAMPAPAAANDSAAAIGIGGLTLARNDAISMDEEDLFISRQEVRVRYRFTNHADHDVETLVSFPVPDLPGGIDGYFEDTSMPDFRGLDFHTTVDGKAVKLDTIEQAEIGGRDVTRRVGELGWPLRWYATYPESVRFIDGLTEDQKAAFVREGLLHHSDQHDALLPAWNVVTHVTRRQTFPAGRSVEVTHRYTPLAGGSVGGALDKAYRDSPYFAEYARQYCIDDHFLAGFDRRQVRAAAAGKPFYVEHWLSYILHSGANWRGPIGRFRLVVDKDSPDNLVSFCMSGVHKISPTRFEVRKTGFEPDSDIDVLIVEWVTPE